MSGRLIAAFVAAVALGVGAVLVGWLGEIGPFDDEPRRATLKVMTFNVFYGGDDLDLETGDWCAETNGCPETIDAVVQAIVSSGADVVGLEEAEGNTAAIADRLGWHASPRTQIVSRFPILEPPAADGAYVLVEVEPGQAVAVSSVHLPATPYGPYRLRDGATLDEVVTLETATRIAPLTERLQHLDPVLGEGGAVFLVGDFNSPSHLDWTDAAASARDEVPFAVRWPVGALASEAGFRDSYREAHPDPLARPGFTWTPGGPEGAKREVHDRIDWVLVAGPAETLASELVGERAYPSTDVAVDPFPSDHRGVVSTFSVELRPLPPLVSIASRGVVVGTALAADVRAPVADARLVAVPAGGDVDGALVGAGVDGKEAAVVLPTSELGPGAYDAVLVRDERELARAPFWVYPGDRGPALDVRAEAVVAGEPFEVAFAAAPGNRWDWLGVYRVRPGAPTTDAAIPADAGAYVVYAYTGGEVEGVVSFDEGAQPGSGAWPLRPGTYEVRLLVDDGYVTVARSQPFTVRG